MICKLTGLMMKAYVRKHVDKSSGQEVSTQCFDVYDGSDVVRVAKIPDDLFSSVKRMTVTELPVRVYSNQYGLSVVFDSEGGEQNA